MLLEKEGKGELRSQGKKWSAESVKEHLVNILDGQYSRDWSDVALIEQRVVTHSDLDGYYTDGVPDIRVIVFEGFPVMSMIRLPTEESQGAANLHKGAVGMGLRIHDGKGVNPFWRGHGGNIIKHPDTGKKLIELKLKDWKGILEVASKSQAASRLGYVGADIVLDRSGPMVLEVNKRPGLEIQNTNLAGLLSRVQFIEKRMNRVEFLPISKKIELARKWDRRGWK